MKKMTELELKNWIIITCIFFAAIIAAGASALQYIDGVKKDKKNDDLQKELIKTQSKLNDLQNETLKRVMGYGFVRIKVGNINGLLVQIIAENTSDYPIYESEIMVFDQDQINLCPKVHHEGKEYIFSDCYLNAATKLPVYNFTEKTMRQLHSIKLLGKDLHLH